VSVTVQPRVVRHPHAVPDSTDSDSGDGGVVVVVQSHAASVNGSAADPHLLLASAADEGRAVV